MKVPYRNKAFITQEKILNYLLNTTNPDGKAKAIFFRSKGFNETNTDIFEESLLSVIYMEDVERQSESQHGKKYTVKGDIATPNGEMITIRTVWIVENNTRKPRLVSAYRV